MKKLYSIAVTYVTFFTLFTFSNQAANAQALTLQSSFDLSNAVSGGGNAGVVFTGTEYWVSKWYIDSIYRLTPTGTVIDGFVIPGVKHVRSFTTDGTFIYAGSDSNVITKINPATKTLAGTITAPSNVRHVSYSATANGGAGGLWVGRSGTDLMLLSLTGTVLQTISYANHGLTRMYGSAYDTTTAGGGPFLWIFDQGATGSAANLVRIPVTTGIPDYTYNVLSDFPAVTGGVAGGAYLSYTISQGQKTLIVVIPGIPNILARYTVSSTTLPIRLVSFKGEIAGTKNVLQWTTATEVNNKGFEVQRSADGSRFTTIAFVASQALNGNSVKNLTYSYTDEHPLAGGNYYRLNQVDKDGKTSLSNTIALRKSTDVLKAAITRSYPNPVSSVLNIAMNVPASDKITFIVTDSKGTAVLKQTSQAVAGSNLFAVKAQSLAPGTYVLKAIGKDGQSIGETKFLKQ